MRWLVGVLVLLLVTLVFGLGLLVYAMYVLLGVMLVSRWLTHRWAQAVHAWRQCNEFALEVGELVTVVIRVENRSGLWIPWVLIEDLLPRHALLPPPGRLQVRGRRLHLLAIGPHDRKNIMYQLHCAGRGFFQIGPLVLETGDLFGLHRRYRVLTEPHFILVYPEVVPLEGYDIASRRPIGEVCLSHRLYEDPTRIAGVRHYEQGDPMRRIHWRATARTGTLHSKLYEPSTVSGATIVLDFHQSGYPGEDGSARAELAVVAAASIANALYEMGQQVGLVTNGCDAADRIRQEGWDYDIRSRQAAQRAGEMLPTSDRLRPVMVETRRGPEQFFRIRETLARVELTDGLHLAELLSETASRLPHDATVLAIVPRADQTTAIALGNLRRRGLAVVAVVNTYEVHDFEQAAGHLQSEGIEARHLRNKESIVTLCSRYVAR